MEENCVNISSGEAHFHSHETTVTSFEVFEKFGKVVTGSDDHEVRVIDIDSKAVLFKELFKGEVNHVEKFHEDDFLVASFKGELVCYSIVDFSIKRTFDYTDFESYIYRVTKLTSDLFLLMNYADELMIFSFREGKCVRKLTDQPISSTIRTAVSKNYENCVYLTNSSTAMIIDQGGVPLILLDYEKDFVVKRFQQPDKTRTSGSQPMALRLHINERTGEEYAILGIFQYGDPSSTRSKDEEPRVVVYNTLTGECIRILRGGDGICSMVMLRNKFLFCARYLPSRRIGMDQKCTFSLYRIGNILEEANCMECITQTSLSIKNISYCMETLSISEFGCKILFSYVERINMISISNLDLRETDKKLEVLDLKERVMFMNSEMLEDILMFDIVFCGGTNIRNIFKTFLL